MADSVIGDYTAAITIDGSTNYLLIQPGNASTAYKKINRNVFLGVTGQPVDISSNQNISNKSLDNTNSISVKDNLFVLQDQNDTTKQAKFDISGNTTATVRTYTFPNASVTIADTSTAQTFTNKTLTSPIINGGSIDNTTITVDAISGHTDATIVTVAGLQISGGVLNSNNSVVSSNIASFSYGTSDVSNPYKFSVYKDADSQTVNTGSNTIVVFDGEEFDTNSNFTSNTYTAPVDGYYIFACSLGYDAVGSGTRLFANLYVNGVFTKRGDDRSTGSISGSGILNVMVQLSATDTVDIRATPVGANTVIDNTQQKTWFQGWLFSKT